MAIAGRVAIVPKGDWSADATYKRLDAVTYNNTLYFAKKEVPVGTATSNTEYWSKSIVGGAGGVATADEAGVVKPDGKSMSVDESGTLSINLDGTTITLDEAKNVIKLADTLKDKIGSALQPESIVNNQITTVEGFALDARQANPNLDGTLAKQVADLNGNLKMIDCGIGAFSKSDSALNVGTTMKTRVKFNKTFDRDPVVVVSWSERYANSYLNYLTIDGLTVDGEGFEAITRAKDADTWKYNWYFSWIAIAN